MLSDDVWLPSGSTAVVRATQESPSRDQVASPWPPSELKTQERSWRESGSQPIR